MDLLYSRRVLQSHLWIPVQVLIQPPLTHLLLGFYQKKLILGLVVHTVLVRKNIKVMLEEISPSKIILCCQCERVHFIAVEPNGNSEFISAYQKIKNKIKDGFMSSDWYCSSYDYGQLICQLYDIVSVDYQVNVFLIFYIMFWPFIFGWSAEPRDSITVRNYEMRIHELNTLEWDELLVSNDPNNSMAPKEGN